MVVTQVNAAIADPMSFPESSSREERPLSTRLDTTAWLISNRITHQLAIWGGRFIPLLLVAEHPRSGGTWLAHMLADYLQIPFPKYLRRPTNFEAVVHTHLPYSPRLRRAVFVKRDGRDLVVSSYFYVLKRLLPLAPGDSRRRKYLHRYPSLDGATGDLPDTRRRLPEFIAQWWRRPPGCRLNWEQYSTPWLTGSNTIVTSYEALRSNCEAELRRIVPSISSQPIDDPRIAATVTRHSFEAQTGRRPGDEDALSNKRKGIVGDWRNYFSSAAATEFSRLGGQTLITLGYEIDNSWITTCCS